MNEQLIVASRQALETIVMGKNRGATIHALRTAIEQAEKQQENKHEQTN